jgi:hypothetical protein
VTIELAAFLSGNHSPVRHKTTGAGEFFSGDGTRLAVPQIRISPRLDSSSKISARKARQARDIHLFVFMSDHSQNKQQSLQFPLLWHGRLIVDAENLVSRQTIERVFTGLGLALASLSLGGVSSSGRYCSWQISAQIPSLALFRAVSQALCDLPGVKILL